MPILEHACVTESCGQYSRPVEHYFHHAPEQNPACEACGGPTVLMISRFGIVWTGDITPRYNDRDADKDPAKAHETGFWAWRTKSSVSGKPEPVRITTWQEHREFARAEGLSFAGELPRNIQISEDGKRLNSQGMPGSWV